MAIRPLDLQVMIPRLQDVSRINHLDQNKGQALQDNLASTLEKNTKHEAKTVAESKEDEKSKNQADAKDQGKNSYYSDPRDKKQKEQQQEAAENVQRHKIDIKV